MEKIKESGLDKKILFGGANYYIPTFKYTPDKIFANLIPALDINFVNPIIVGENFKKLKKKKD